MHLRRAAARRRGRAAVSATTSSDTPLLARGRTQRLDALRRELREVDRVELELDAPRLDLRDQQQILDEAVQSLGAAADHVEIRLPGLADPCSSSCIISRKPEIDVSGVRSSCDTVATNASRMRSSSRSAVTSRSVQTRPIERRRRRTPAPCSRGSSGPCPASSNSSVVAASVDSRAPACAAGIARARLAGRRSRAAARATVPSSGMPSSMREPHERRVRDQDVAVGVREADPVERRVDQRGLQRCDAPLRLLARAEPPPDDAGADPHQPEGGRAHDDREHRQLRACWFAARSPRARARPSLPRRRR